jgi:hypothetical protein
MPVMPISSPLGLTEVEESPLPTPLFPLHTKILLLSLFSPLHTQKTEGWGVFPSLTFKYHLKCRRADIFDFSPDFSHLFPSAPQLRLHPAPKEEQESWHPDRVGTGASQRYIEECRRRADPPHAKRREAADRHPGQVGYPWLL